MSNSSTAAAMKAIQLELFPARKPDCQIDLYVNGNDVCVYDEDIEKLSSAGIRGASFPMSTLDVVLPRLVRHGFKMRFLNL